MTKCDCCGENVDTDQDPVLCDECVPGILGLMAVIGDAEREVNDE
jgi:hypothetical protein